LSPWRGLPKLELAPNQQKRSGILLDNGDNNEVRMIVRDGKCCMVWFVEDENGELVKRRSLLSLPEWSDWSSIFGVDSDIDLGEVWNTKKVKWAPLNEVKEINYSSGWFDDVIVDYELDELVPDEVEIDCDHGDEIVEDESDYGMDESEYEFSDGEGDYRDIQVPTAYNADSKDYEGPSNPYNEFSRSFVENKQALNRRKPLSYVSRSRNGFNVADEFCKKNWSVDPPLYPLVDKFDNHDVDIETVEGGEMSEELEEEFEAHQLLTSEHRSRVVFAIINTIQLMTKGGEVDQNLHPMLVELIENLCNEAFEWGDNVFDESHAQIWSAGFGFTEEELAEDLKCFIDADRNFDDMIRTRLAKLKPNRLNLDRVHTHVSSDCVDLPLIKDLAADTGGMDLFLPPEYVSNSVTGLPKLSKSYQNTHEAVDKMIHKNFREKGLAMVFKLEDIKEYLPVFSVSIAKWAAKKGEESGRNINDASFHELSGWCLNNEFSKQACKDHCGAIEYPSIQDIIAMIWEFWEREKKKNPNVKWSDIRLWKMDLKGAFTLLDFKAECVKHVALLLHGGLIAFFLCGVFGWTGTPGYFQILSRVLMFELEKILRGLARMFCDDIMGVCWRKDLDHEIAVTKAKILGLAGPNSVAEKKTEFGVALVELGYLVDLHKMTVSISRRNLFKALFGFMEIKEYEVVTFKMIERLASWGSRYSLVCVHMAPMVRLLYCEIQAKPRWMQWRLSDKGKIAIWFFRAFLVLTDVIEGYYCRPLWSLRPLRSWVWICEFDACPQGLGCVWYQCTPDGFEIPIGAASWSISSLGFEDDSSFQNTAEFMAAVMSVIGLIRYGGAGQPSLMRGDSKSALSWADKKRYRGNLAVPAGFLFNYVWIHYKVLLCKCVHLPAEENLACDDLTRIFLENVKAFKELAKSDSKLKKGERKYSHDYSAVGDRSACVEIEEFKIICDPRQVWKTESDFGVFWGRMTRWCCKVLGKPPEQGSYLPEGWDRDDIECGGYD